MSFHYGNHLFVTDTSRTVNLSANQSNDIAINDLCKITATTKHQVSPTYVLPVLGFVTGTDMAGYINLVYNDETIEDNPEDEQIYINFSVPRRSPPIVLISELKPEVSTTYGPDIEVPYYINVTTEGFSINYYEPVPTTEVIQKRYNYICIDYGA